MVSTSLALQILSVLIGAGSLLVGGYAKFFEHPEDRYSEKVKQLQNNRWGEASAELGSLLVDIEESYDPENDYKETISLSERYGLHIQQQFERGKLEDVEKELRAVDRPKECYTEMRQVRDTIIEYTIFGIVAAGFAACAFFLGSNPSSLFIIPGSAALGGSTALLISVVRKGKRYRELRKQLDEMWEEYEFM